MEKSRRSHLPDDDIDYEQLRIQCYAYFLEQEGKNPYNPENWKGFVRAEERRKKYSSSDNPLQHL